MDESITKRRFLRGLGATIALPMLECSPAFAKGGSAATPTRMAFVYLPNGVIVPKWAPKGDGTNWQLSDTLSPLKNVKSDLQVISGLAHDKANANGDGGGDHARATATFLTGRQARKTAGADIKLGVSVDQIAAEKLSGQTKLDSLELGCDPARKAGRCDSGYSCAYQFNFAWKDENLPLPPEIDPRIVFEKMFGGGISNEDPGAKAKRLSHEQSILDYVMDDAKSLQRKLGYTDSQKIEEYLTGVREMEKKIENAEKFRDSMPDVKVPRGIPANYRDHIRIMYDMLLLAFQSDTTRISTFLVAHDGSNRSFRDIGVPEGHHHLSHHRNDQAKIDKLAKIDKFYVEQFAYFLEKMKATKDPAGTNLLDSSMIVFGGGHSDANRHDHDNLPIVLAGRGNGTLQPGRHIRTGHAPMTNLYLTLLDKLGVHEDRLGDSTGRFDKV
ncbi:MAG: DUF1552 domain-containing protein [Verrucomicrobiales bacterium]|nr:DUF1552 domain-containing protein [Verrucomicrobiales bacterium]